MNVNAYRQVSQSRMAAWLRVLVLIAAAANGAAPGAAPTTGDPLAGLRRVAGKSTVECSGALETMMLLAQLGSTAVVPTEFQAQARARFVLRAGHPAVRETTALMSRGFGYLELAWLSTLMTSAPYFVLADSEDLNQLAGKLPGGDTAFNLDRLHGYAKLVREFYWDNHIGQFLRSSLSYYQQAIRQALPSEVPPGAKVLISPLAPLGPGERIEFERRTSRPVPYLVFGGR